MQVKQASRDPRIFIVGDYLFEPSVGLISGAGGAHRVCAETSALLLYLVERSEEDVPPERLIGDLWDGAPGGERALTNGVARLRHYFDDPAETPRYIDRTPAGAYRLIAPVYTDNGEPVAAASAAGRPRASGARRIANFILELRDRKVCRAMLLYAIAVWLIAQVSEIIAPALALPDWFTTFVVVVGILGFPIAALLAWVFEIKPEGIVIDLPRESSPQVAGSRSRLELGIDTAMIVAALLLSGHLLINTFSGDVIASPDAARTLAAGGAGESQPHRIAVSPFSVSGDSEQAQAAAHHFLDRMIRSLLQREELIVVWRDGTPRTTPVPTEDRVDSIFKGFVFESADEVSISVYLLDAQSNVYLMSRVLPTTQLDDETLEHEIEATTQAILQVVTAGVAQGSGLRYARKEGAPVPWDARSPRDRDIL
jgi:DNA-binding winged helix-turn-helix (wHTH) protein/TolB-like protein